MDKKTILVGQVEPPEIRYTKMLLEDVDKDIGRAESDLYSAKINLKRLKEERKGLILMLRNIESTTAHPGPSEHSVVITMDGKDIKPSKLAEVLMREINKQKRTKGEPWF